MQAALAGFALGFSLILAIGAQNAFILRQGLRREHVLPLVLTCAISDAILITAGVAGFGALAKALPWLETVMRYGGAAFLIWYGASNLRSAWRGGQILEEPTLQLKGSGRTQPPSSPRGSDGETPQRRRRSAKVAPGIGELPSYSWDAELQAQGKKTCNSQIEPISHPVIFFLPRSDLTYYFNAQHPADADASEGAARTSSVCEALKKPAACA
jgi:hypothetical protein